MDGVSVNINRRHMTAAQRAMATAMIYADADKRGRGNKGKAAASAGFSERRLRDARAVLADNRINRRHMTAAQRAMAVAMMYPESDGAGGYGNKGKAFATNDFSGSSLASFN